MTKPTNIAGLGLYDRAAEHQEVTCIYSLQLTSGTIIATRSSELL